jgi:hypothetical protein
MNFHIIICAYTCASHIACAQVAKDQQKETSCALKTCYDNKIVFVLPLQFYEWLLNHLHTDCEAELVEQ